MYESCFTASVEECTEREIRKVGVGDYVRQRERERERGLFSNRGGEAASAIIVRGYI